MDRSWMEIRNRRHPLYVQGVKEFIKFAIDHMPLGQTLIRCPCIRCNNFNKMTPDEAEEHMYAWGVVVGYSRWVYHGEEFDQVYNGHDNPTIEEESIIVDEMQEILDDVRAEQSTNDGTDSTATGHGSDMPNDFQGEGDRFARLMRDAEKELYPGCQKFSVLSFIVMLLHIKIISKWSNNSFDMLLKLLSDAFPHGATIPRTYKEAKKVIRDLGLHYEKIHVCKNDCVLFWKEYKFEDKCPSCNTPRYKFQEGKRNRVPHKVLRYFPIKRKLRRFFGSRKIAADMTWHKDKRIEEEGVMRHPADSLAWKEFDQKHESFASDPRNVRLGLASDGFNPFGNMSTSYCVWPVILVLYNLPPWKCMKDPFFMLSLLIPGRRAPGVDIDVFLRPLIDELKELWTIGIDTYDAVTKQNFQLRAALLWTINDLPAYAYLSGWSTKGKLACPNCNEDASHLYLHHGKKTCYMGHSRFLPADHPLRKSSHSFDGKDEDRSEPKMLSGEDILAQLNNVVQAIFGKVDERGKKSNFRQFAPLQAKSWEKVPQDAKDICVAHIREKFELPEATYVDTAMLRTMGRRYCDMRTRLKKKFTEGEVDCPADIEEADWIYLCNLWQDEDYKLKCGKYKVSRSKPRIHHAAGSRAFYKVKNDMIKEGLNHELPELWKQTHYSKKRKSWTNGSKDVYDKLKQVKDQSMENGSTPLSDEELSRTVLGHKSGYLRGLGDGPKPSSTKSGQISRAQLIRDAEEARQEAAALKRSCEEAQMIAAEARKNSEQLAETVANMQSTLNFLLQQQNGRNVPSNDANCSTINGDHLVNGDTM